MSFIDVCNYQPSPRSTDSTDIICEKDIAIRWLIRELDEANETLARRERMIGQLLTEISEQA